MKNFEQVFGVVQPWINIWISKYTEKNKHQSGHWYSSDDLAPKKVQKANKLKATLFLECTRCNRHRFLESGRTIYCECYAILLDHFNDDVKEKQPHLSQIELLFHKDNVNVRSHNSKKNQLNYE